MKDSNTTSTTTGKPRWWASKFTLPNGGPSYSEMWGRTEAEVRAIAEKRGFGQPKKKTRVKKEMRPSKLLGLPGGLAHPAIFHTLCYLGFLAAKSGVITAEELVQDGSALHELAHYLCCGPNIRAGTQERVVLNAIRDLERRIPGVPPADVEIL